MATRSSKWLDLVWEKRGEKQFEELEQKSGKVQLHKVDGFETFTSEQYQSLIGQLVKPVPFEDGQYVLECGCGAGAMLQAITLLYPKMSMKMHGVDYSAKQVELAERVLCSADSDQGNGNASNKSEFAFSVADIRTLKEFEDNTFDHVVLFSVLQYLDSVESAFTAIREMLRVVKPGGVVMLGDVCDPEKIRAHRESLRKTQTERAKQKKDAAATAGAVVDDEHVKKHQVAEDELNHLEIATSEFDQIRDLADVKFVDHNDLDIKFYHRYIERYSVYLTKKQ
eukprot:TRINITY_DN67179_c3_g1_i1.p1 TRINITY_DN67179_c3_g1~~TRINITY_DN67179_c3_g1_i1.p1  ORF type:complete len:282 (-),score=173.93 TRINITY_DN67179_c3_g1_i1:140-985(-)